MCADGDIHNCVILIRALFTDHNQTLKTVLWDVSAELHWRDVTCGYQTTSLPSMSCLLKYLTL